MRFYLAPENWTHPQLDDPEAHHAKRVLRLQRGDKITVFDGKGREAEATIEDFYKKGALLKLNESLMTPHSATRITLAQAIPKGNNMDLIIQKAVELGATAIIPIITDRTVIRLHDHDDAKKKQARWQSIALEACKQCGQNWMPIVELPCSLQESLEKTNDHPLLLIASLEKDSLSLREVFSSLEKVTPSPISSASIFIGPEGDFTPEEYQLARSAGCKPVSLGPIILRTETAAFYCLSILSYEFKKN